MADNSPNYLFGKKLQALRLERNITPAQLHELTGIDPRTLQQYEDGQLEPMLETMYVIAKALDVNLKDLLNFDD